MHSPKPRRGEPKPHLSTKRARKHTLPPLCQEKHDASNQAHEARMQRAQLEKQAQVQECADRVQQLHSDLAKGRHVAARIKHQREFQGKLGQLGSPNHFNLFGRKEASEFSMNC
eukprot:3333339-Amphidinium_carterae.1